MLFDISYDIKNFLFRFLKILSIILYCLFTGLCFINSKICYLFFLFTFIMIIYLFLFSFKKKIYFEKDFILIKCLFFTKKIFINDIISFSCNISKIETLFCYSYKNICLFTKKKKICISPKNLQFFKDKLIENNIRENTIHKKYNNIVINYLICLFMLITFRYLPAAPSYFSHSVSFITLFFLTISIIYDLIVFVEKK